MDVEWGLIESFIRAARAGSLTKASKALRSSQPTLSRQIQALEEQLGVPLFVRHARGLHLTEHGAELLHEASAVDEYVQRFLRRAAGMRLEPEGAVRISAAEPIAVEVLAPVFARLRRERPAITLELVVDNSLANLSRRDADIAVRMVRPTGLDLVAKRVGSVEVGLFASEAYLAEHGAPRSLDDVEGHTLIGFDRDSYWLDAVRRLGMRPDDFAFRTDSIIAQVSAVRAGVGIGTLHLGIARRYELMRVLEGVPLGELELWLVMHQDVRGNPAVRAVLDALEAGLARYAAEGRVPGEEERG